MTVVLFAPRMWRCFSLRALALSTPVVCSTHVEMFPEMTKAITTERSLLHACGDVSSLAASRAAIFWFAPRMWRCFFIFRRPHYGKDVCSTHVEMFLSLTISRLMTSCLLHACGDVSTAAQLQTTLEGFAPRMWRCFSWCEFQCSSASVCSTHVEMFLRLAKTFGHAGGLLHACGDVSGGILSHQQKGPFAPRMWRCFSSIRWEASLSRVCSTHVEMFPSFTC